MGGVRGTVEKQTYKIREAHPMDFSKVLPMAKAFYESTVMAETMPFDLESILEHYINMLENGVVLVAEVDGELVGMVGSLFHQFPLNRQYKVSSEQMWWVDPDYRGLAIAKDLVMALEATAKAQGCSKNLMSLLSTSPPLVANWYEQAGYAKVEAAYSKEL